MKLDEIFQICLLALLNRHPRSVLESNKAMLEGIALVNEPASPREVLQMLQERAPHLLQAPARLVIDDQRSEIYLLEVSEVVPAFWVYCEGNLPSSHQKPQRESTPHPALLLGLGR